MFSGDTEVLLLSFGFIFIGLGLTACLGYWKNWYWLGGGAPYGLIPLGAIFILYGFQDKLQSTFTNKDWLTTTLLLLFIAVGAWWALRPPAFLKPRWVRWVEKYPGSVTNAMRREAKKGSDWVSHVSSEAAVDAWAKACKHK